MPGVTQKKTSCSFKWETRIAMNQYIFRTFWKLFCSIFWTARGGRSCHSRPEWLIVHFAKGRTKGCTLF